MRMSKWWVVLATLVAGTVGCGAEAGDAVLEESAEGEDVGEVTQEMRNGSHAFGYVLGGTSLVANHSGTSAGGGIVPTKIATGLYKIILTGLSGGGSINNLQVVAAGGGSQRCKADSYFLNVVTNQVEIKVRCVTAAGGLADSDYMFHYGAANSSTGRGTGAFLRITGHNDPVPLVASSWNSAGLSNTVTQGMPGDYLVVMEGVASPGGTVQVTATGMTADHCKAISWAPFPFSFSPDQSVVVRCFNSAGTMVSSPFSVNYIVGASSVGIRTRGAFALLNANGSNSSTYTGNTTTVSGVCSAGTTTSKSTPGTYTYRPASMAKTGGLPHVTAAESNGNYCKVGGITTAPDGFVNVNLACYNSSGTKTDTKHMVTYAHSVNPTSCP